MSPVFLPKHFLRLWGFHIKKNGYILEPGENSRGPLLSGNDNSKAKVPRGHLAVYVGSSCCRFVIPTSYLSMPDFRAMMEWAADEFGFEHEGGLRIPCEEEDFEHLLMRCLAKHGNISKKKGKKNQKNVS